MTPSKVVGDLQRLGINRSRIESPGMYFFGWDPKLKSVPQFLLVFFFLRFVEFPILSFNVHIKICIYYQHTLHMKINMCYLHTYIYIFHVHIYIYIMYIYIYICKHVFHVYTKYTCIHIIRFKSGCFFNGFPGLVKKNTQVPTTSCIKKSSCI